MILRSWLLQVLSRVIKTRRQHSAQEEKVQDGEMMWINSYSTPVENNSRKPITQKMTYIMTSATMDQKEDRWLSSKKTKKNSRKVVKHITKKSWRRSYHKLSVSRKMNRFQKKLEKPFRTKQLWHLSRANKWIQSQIWFIQPFLIQFHNLIWSILKTIILLLRFQLDVSKRKLRTRRRIWAIIRLRLMVRKIPFQNLAK